MQSEVKHLEGLKKEMVVSVSSEEVEATYEKILKNFVHKAAVPGFRAGKVPRRVVEQKYKGRLSEQLMSEVLRDTYQPAIEKTGLNLASAPVVDCKELKRGEDFEYTVQFEVYPEMALASLAEEKFERYTSSLSKADITQEIDVLKKQFATWEPIEAPAELGNVVVVDYALQYGEDLSLDDSGESLKIVLDEEDPYLAELHKALVGVVKGDKKIVELVFPEDYPQKVFAGKQGKFDLQVQEVQVSTLPDEEKLLSYLRMRRMLLGMPTLESAHEETNNDAVAADEEQVPVVTSEIDSENTEKSAESGAEQVHSEEETLALLTQCVEEDLKERFEQTLKRQLEEQVFSAFFQKNTPIEVPVSLVEQEKKRLAEQLPSEMSQEEIDKLIKERVEKGLLFSKALEEYKVELSDNEVKSRVEQYKRQESIQAAFGQKSSPLGEDQVLEAVKETLYKEALTDALLATSQQIVEEKPISYLDFLELEKKKEEEEEQKEDKVVEA